MSYTEAIKLVQEGKYSESGLKSLKESYESLESSYKEGNQEKCSESLSKMETIISEMSVTETSDTDEESSTESSVYYGKGNTYRIQGSVTEGVDKRITFLINGAKKHTMYVDDLKLMMEELNIQ